MCCLISSNMLENKSIDKQTQLCFITRMTICILNTRKLSGYCNYNACASTC